MKNPHICHIDCIPLPPVVQKLKTAQSELPKHWPESELKFTLDGRLLGDIAEAIVAVQFDLRFAHELSPKKKRTKGVDLWTADGAQTVQVKCSASDMGPAYGSGADSADYLIFGLIHFESNCFELVYNGKEVPVRELLEQPRHKDGYNPESKKAETRRVALGKIRELLQPKESQLPRKK
jgi:hypothetical protein